MQQRVSVPGTNFFFFFFRQPFPNIDGWSRDAAVTRISWIIFSSLSLFLSLFPFPPFLFSLPLSLFPLVSFCGSILACGVKGIRVQPDLGSVQIPIDKKSAPTPGTITLADSSDSPTTTQPIFFSIPPRHGSVGPHGGGRDESFRLVLSPCTLPASVEKGSSNSKPSPLLWTRLSKETMVLDFWSYRRFLRISKKRFKKKTNNNKILILNASKKFSSANRGQVFHDRTPFVGHKVYPGSANGLSSDLTSPRVTSTVYYSWPVTKPWIFSLPAVPFFWSRKRASPFYARALFFMPYVEHSLHPYHPRRHCLVHLLLHLHPLSSLTSPVSAFFPFFLSSLNFKRTVTVPQEIVILIFLIFSFFTNPLHVYRLSTSP